MGHCNVFEINFRSHIFGPSSRMSEIVPLDKLGLASQQVDTGFKKINKIFSLVAI